MLIDLNNRLITFLLAPSFNRFLSFLVYVFSKQAVFSSHSPRTIHKHQLYVVTRGFTRQNITYKHFCRNLFSPHANFGITQSVRTEELLLKKHVRGVRKKQSRKEHKLEKKLSCRVLHVEKTTNLAFFLSFFQLQILHCYILFTWMC